MQFFDKIQKLFWSMFIAWKANLNKNEEYDLKLGILGIISKLDSDNWPK